MFTAAAFGLRDSVGINGGIVAEHKLVTRPPQHPIILLGGIILPRHLNPSDLIRTPSSHAGLRTRPTPTGPHTTRTTTGSRPQAGGARETAMLGILRRRGAETTTDPGAAATAGPLKMKAKKGPLPVSPTAVEKKGRPDAAAADADAYHRGAALRASSVTASYSSGGDTSPSVSPGGSPPRPPVGPGGSSSSRGSEVDAEGEEGAAVVIKVCMVSVQAGVTAIDHAPSTPRGGWLLVWGLKARARQPSPRKEVSSHVG